MNTQARYILVALLMSNAMWAGAAESEADLAKKLSNPVADLISVPIKLDWDTGIGPNNADRSTYVVQPVIPFTLNEKWNVISRTIVPYIDGQSPGPGSGDYVGLGDIQQSFFFSPKAPTSGGWVWGVGPIITLDTGSNNTGSGKWSGGPTAVMLRQANGWTSGILANHQWSFAGDSNRTDVSATYVQPFLAFTTKTYTTFGINTESTYNWKASQWTVPINATVSQLVKISGRPVSFLLGYRYYAEAPSGGPDWGLRFQVTLIYPK
jgi:hypothetical protein